jgi:hypothetical protein
MRATPRVFALGAAAVLFSSLGSCIPERDTTPALYTQYSLAEPESSDGVRCYYDCLRWPDEAKRETCLSTCDGIAVNVTREPCDESAPRLCTYERMPGPASTPDDDGSNVAAAIIGGIFKVAIMAVTSAGDGDHERAHASAPSEVAAHREPTRHHEPATSRSARDPRRYVVERPRPVPRPSTRAPST